MGSSTASLAGFVFEGLAISYTSGSSPDPDDTDSFLDFVQMTRVKSDNKAMPIRFAYQGSDKQLTVDISGDQIMFRILPSSVLAASTHNSSLDPPWKGRTRNRVTYDKIEGLALNDSSYYCPLQPNNPLFDAFFLSIDDRTVVLWILQMTIARVHSGARRGFPLVNSLRERASRIWKHHQVEIKYVLVVPHIGSTYRVEWNFDAEFENHEGKVYVQFLNVAPFPLDGITMMKDIFGLNAVEAAT
ncbi:hypothetical protein BJV74DRAFT_375021 [Russula compacta]|nr:hypothetical protein BJV74DRAFT_375021 [Russula compacta]